MNDTGTPGPQGAVAPRGAKPRKHLMDMNAPRPAHNPYREDEGMTCVQQWVVSSLTITTILHLSAGLIIAAMFLPHPTRAAEVGLCVIAGAFGAIAAAAGLAIHKKSMASRWVAAGFLVPTVVGLVLVLR